MHGFDIFSELRFLPALEALIMVEMTVNCHPDDLSSASGSVKMVQRHHLQRNVTHAHILTRQNHQQTVTRVLPVQPCNGLEKSGNNIFTKVIMF